MSELEFKFWRTPEERADSLARIGGTSDGEALRQMLIEVLMHVIPETGDAGALQAEAGRRNFARNLLIAINAGQKLHVSGEQFRRTDAVADQRRRGNDRRVPANSDE